MNVYGDNIKLFIFGQSHAPAIGMTLDGIPAGETIDMAALEKFLARRAPGKNAWSTKRQEGDVPEFLSGLTENVTCGAPISAVIRNTDTRSQDYSNLLTTPRPGHADYTADVKYFHHQDYRGGGAFSGRLTAPLCIAGGICRQLLARHGIEIISRIASIGDIYDRGELLESTAEKDFPVVDDEQGKKMTELIEEIRLHGDSVGGVIECAVLGLPAGLGDPMFGGAENKIAQAAFAIPAVKGIEFGAGFESARMTGSENNDPFAVKDGKIVTLTNNSGGILGGITDGMPLTFRIAVKPTPSISKPQGSVDLTKTEEKELIISGRHDPCIVPRAVPCAESAAAIAIYDMYLGRKKEI